VTTTSCSALSGHLITPHTTTSCGHGAARAHSPLPPARQLPTNSLCSSRTTPFLGATSPGVPENHSELGTNNEHATARRRRLTATVAERQHGLAKLPVADNSDRLPGRRISRVGSYNVKCNPGPGTIPIKSHRRNLNQTPSMRAIICLCFARRLCHWAAVSPLRVTTLLCIITTNAW
jgi:hypothetical protein